MKQLSTLFIITSLMSNMACGLDTLNDALIGQSVGTETGEGEEFETQNIVSSGEDWTELEMEIVDLINDVRAQGYDCASRGYFEPAGPVTMNDILRDAAMAHATDLAENDYFDHFSQDGTSPTERMVAAGYTNYDLVLENIAGGQDTAPAVVQAWLDSDGHCANIMNPDAEECGIAHATNPASTYIDYYVQNCGAR